MRSSFLLASILTAACSQATVAWACIVTEYSQIASAVANCTDIVLQDIVAPTSSSIDLLKLKANSTVTFSGTTTFAFTNDSSFEMLKFGGAGVRITAEPGAVIDGGGQLYWDGLGSNGGLPKPNHFIAVKMTAGSIIENLHIQNWPAHLFSISSSSDLTLRNLTMDNRAGDAPNNRSNGLAAAHNSDGFGVASSKNVLITNSTVYNQDDCVAITSGSFITASDLVCSGGHGMSIGSIGGKSNNNVTNILLEDSYIVNSENGARIKSNFNTTGFISNVTYRNIVVENITTRGIDLQQDYLNGGPTGTPSNGVIVEHILFQNISGTALPDAKNYYVLCGDGSCSDVVFDNVHITGGQAKSSCNYPASGCPAA